MRSAPVKEPLEPTELGIGAVGEGNVVLRRDLPTGKGERPSSHTPEPEDDSTEVVGGILGFVPGNDPTNEDPRDSSPIHLEKGGGSLLHQRAGTTDSVREAQREKSRRIRKAFVGRQRRKRLTPSGGTRQEAFTKADDRDSSAGEMPHTPQIKSWCAT